MPTIIGQIEPASRRIDENAWIVLIESHPYLQHALPRIGINPFTKEPTEFKAPPTHAMVTIDGERAGTIYPAMDDSSALIVSAEDGQELVVEEIAEQIAESLGCRLGRLQ